MRFLETELAGAWLLEPEKNTDGCGYVTCLRCAREFAERGLPGEFVQTNLSYNRTAETFRGLHYQARPSQERKLVHCIRWDDLQLVIGMPGEVACINTRDAAYPDLDTDSLTAIAGYTA